MIKRSIQVAVAVLLVLAASVAGRTEDVSQVLLLELSGVIGPASKDFVVRGISRAENQDADLVVIRMDTPGGLDSSMRDIIQSILSSTVPVATYVAPGGARAASAGTYILYASHIAAMAPATNLGAATPVRIGGGSPFSPTPQEQPPEEEPEQDDEAAIDGESDEQGKSRADEESKSKSKSKPKPKAPKSARSSMEKKIINDARAYIRSLAQLRGRNVEWAEQAVEEAASLSAEEALEQNVIDIVAANVADLLAQSTGRTVEIKDGQTAVLDIENPTIETVEPDWRNRILAVITHPQVAYILMLLGIYGLFFELSNPGSLIPGVLGGICILLALFAFQVLPTNYTGLALIVLGIAFMIGEAFMPSFGVLGIGGVVAFVAGSLILWDKETTGYQVPLSLVLGFAAVSAALFIGLGYIVARNRRRPDVSGDAALIGRHGEAMEDFVGEGRIQLQGENWRARSVDPIHKGQAVQVAGRDGLVLTVVPRTVAETESNGY